MASKEKLMKGVSAMDRILNVGDISPQDAPEQPEPVKQGKSSTKETKAVKKPEKGKKKVFSFRADESKVIQWRLQAVARGITVDDLGQKAIDEYISRHKLTDTQKQLFELNMMQKKS